MMNILNLLTEHPESLIPEDFEFLETEIQTGDYTELEKHHLLEKLTEVRNWMKPSEPDDTYRMEAAPKKGGRMMLNLSALLPQQQRLPQSPEDILRQELENLRAEKHYKTLFKDYIKHTDNLTEAEIDRYFQLFTPYEIGAMVEVRQFSEAFLEKYFHVIDHDKIARYQLFSEVFFLKHFLELDVELVLKGKNEWRKKENRSKQLDVFLRLKGIKL